MSYYNDYDESVTLEEAMDYIDDYLTEKGAFGKYYDNRNEMIKKLQEERDEYAKKIDKFTGRTYDKAVEKLNNYNERINNLKYSKSYGSPSTDFINSMRKDRDYIELKNAKSTFKSNTGGPSKRNKHHSDAGDRGRQTIPESLIRANAQKKAKREAQNQRTQESVNELRLQVFEAYESGAISEDEKYTFLDYLNLDNYE